MLGVVGDPPRAVGAFLMAEERGRWAAVVGTAKRGAPGGIILGSVVAAPLAPAPLAPLVLIVGALIAAALWWSPADERAEMAVRILFALLRWNPEPNSKPTRRKGGGERKRKGKPTTKGS